MSAKQEQAQRAKIKEFIAKIQEKDDRVRGEAWQSAEKIGPGAVMPLARVMADPKFEVHKDDPEAIWKLEVGRAAKRALWRIVRHVGRPGADGEKKTTVTRLKRALDRHTAVSLRREVLWMLSEIGEDDTVEPISGLLSDKSLREDARMVLERIPGEKSLAALQAGLAAAPEEFKINIAQSLRKRGVTVPGLPCQKLVPKKKTGGGTG